MNMPKATRTHAELIDGFTHIDYELSMTAETSVRLLTTPASAARDAFLESMLLHIRTLTDFFVYTNPRPWPTDMLRTEFAPEWTPPEPEASRLLDKRDTIHKHLAHLTWDRVDDGKQDYFLAATDDVIRIADAWGQHLAVHAPALHPVYRKSVLKAQAVVARRSPYSVMQVVTTTSS